MNAANGEDGMDDATGLRRAKVAKGVECMVDAGNIMDTVLSVLQNRYVRAGTLG